MIFFNSTQIDSIEFNGTGLDVVMHNGVTVFSRHELQTLIMKSEASFVTLTVESFDGSPVEVRNNDVLVATILSKQKTRVNLNDATKPVVVSGFLKTLNCPYNQLTSLDASNCPELKYLYCYHNQLTSLDVSNCPELLWLNCPYNQLTSLDVSNCPELTNLYCYDNQLTSLDVSNCPELTALHCYNNKITIAGFIAFFKSLKDRNGHTTGKAYLFSDSSNEQNLNNFATPPPLRAAYLSARNRNWKFFSSKNLGYRELPDPE